jgi:enterochelin esterase-like enzyme
VLHELIVEAPELGGSRRARVYVPAGADPNEPRPTLYLFDGQNVFGDDGSFCGGWQAHVAADKLVAGKSAVAPLIVGIDHGGEERIDELGPFGEGGRTDKLLAFMASRLIPTLSKRFAMIAGSVGAVVGGSSMGGLAAMYAHHRRPDVFGGALCMSPSFWFANAAIIDFVARTPRPPISRIYLDCGVREGSGRMLPPVVQIEMLLRNRGYAEGELMWRQDARGAHSEKHWQRRLPKALRFMFRT